MPPPQLPGQKHPRRDNNSLIFGYNRTAKVLIYCQKTNKHVMCAIKRCELFNIIYHL